MQPYWPFTKVTRSFSLLLRVGSGDETNGDRAGPLLLWEGHGCLHAAAASYTFTVIWGKITYGDRIYLGPCHHRNMENRLLCNNYCTKIFKWVDPLQATYRIHTKELPLQ